MQLTNINRSKIFRFSDKCCVFLTAVDVIILFLYILGSYQHFLNSSKFFLLFSGVATSLLLMMLTVFSLVLAMFFHLKKKRMLGKRLIFNISFFVFAFIFLCFFIFILTWSY